MSNIFHQILNDIMPCQCLLCADHGKTAFCAACYHTLVRWQRSDSCPRCGHVKTQGHLCGACLQAPPAFDATYAGLLYVEPISALIQAAKFGGKWALLAPLSEFLLAAIPQENQPDRLIALPLHSERLIERGFNQAVEIARPIARALQIPLELNHFQRIKNTEHQARLSANARWQNMRNAFEYDGDLTEQRIAIIDDVMTSGASLNAAAKALKAAGASEVQAWIVARTP